MFFFFRLHGSEALRSHATSLPQTSAALSVAPPVESITGTSTGAPSYCTVKPAVAEVLVLATALRQVA